ncbi:class F sortase [Herbidospora mongoliensis]|uniref:class F sortase n=1 Tax=Herbidospora mongoliensis TaxID=688067 RepID=UPI000B32A1EA|nr:class F sortase [Herbidospora mongoliensis]
MKTYTMRAGALLATALLLAACAGEGAPPAQAATVGAQVAPVAKDVANPTRVRIPAIKVNSQIIPLKLDKKGKLIAPKRFDVAGWHKSGPEPGEKGVAVIAAHVDSKSGPAVFYRLRELKTGHKITVNRADGSSVTFTVYRIARYPKNEVPNKLVYASGGGAQLRLITCGGTFDRDRRSYRDNIVVFAR